MSAEVKHCCIEDCPIGKAKSQELLAGCNSAYDAAMDFIDFVNKCSKECQYKNNLNKED
jgi:hypothetical protein